MLLVSVEDSFKGSLTELFHKSETMSNVTHYSCCCWVIRNVIYIYIFFLWWLITVTCPTLLANSWTTVFCERTRKHSVKPLRLQASSASYFMRTRGFRQHRVWHCLISDRMEGRRIDLGQREQRYSRGPGWIKTQAVTLSWYATKRAEQRTCPGPSGRWFSSCTETSQPSMEVHSDS